MTWLLLAIKTLFLYLILIISIIWLIYCEVYYINYFILKLLYQYYVWKPIISILNHLFYLKLFYILYLSISIKPIIYMIINYINYFWLFHSNYNNWYIRQYWYDKSAMLYLIFAIYLQPHWLSLHIAGPAQSTRIDKPHPASIPGTLPAVAWRSLKTIAQAVLNGSGVTDRNYWQFSQDTFNGDDVENWFLVTVVKLVWYPGTDRFQPAWNALIRILAISTIIYIIDIITILRIVIWFQLWYKCAFRRTWIQCQSYQMLRTKANLSIPDCIWLHNKAAIINTRLHNHDHVQAMTAVKGFGWKWIAVNL